MILTILLAALLSIPGGNDSTVTDALRHYSQKVLSDWKIPGMSVSVVKDGELIFNEGFGVKRQGESDRVDEHTLFHVGSISKSFTATVMASVVDDGLLKWDDRVKDILPDFDWADDEVEQQMLVKDLFTHATGLCPQVGTYIANLGYDRNDIYQMFKYMKPIYPFRSQFGYNNITFIIAARIIEKVTGMTWEDNVRMRVFAPLGMNESCIGGDEYDAAGRKASCAHAFHYRRGKDGSDGIRTFPLDGENRALWWVSVIGPAGSVCSTSSDMAKYVSCHLENGEILSLGGDEDASDSGQENLSPEMSDLSDYFPGLVWRKQMFADKRIFSPEQMEFLHTGSTYVSGDSTFVKRYGYCWYVQENENFREIYHTGTTWGFTALCGFVPELDLGYAILCNSEVTQRARFALSKEIVDLFFALRDGRDIASVKDHSGQALKGWYSLCRNGGGGSGRKVPMIIKRSKVKPDFSTLVGHYTKEAPFGDAEVTLENGKLFMKIGPKGWKHPLRHSSGNQFLMDSQGHTFPVYFHGYETPSSNVDFEIDFNYNENFGPWRK
ncbi:MAG: serine hydrolase [Alistipes sp.]|nr:serine hydrolase [Candidatus Minthomonas equi]